MSRETFHQAYYEVFTPNGCIKVCGRKACIHLMQVCVEEANSAGVELPSDLGDSENGFLRIESIKALVSKIYPDITFRELYLKAFPDDGTQMPPDDHTMNEIITFAMLAARDCNLILDDFKLSSLQKLCELLFPEN